MWCSQKQRWREIMASVPVQSPAWCAEPPSFTCFTKIVSIGSRRHRGLPEKKKKKSRKEKVILHSQDKKVYYTTDVLLNQVSNTNEMFLFKNRNQMTINQFISVMFLIKNICLKAALEIPDPVFHKLTLKRSRCVHGKYQRRAVYREKI